MTARSTASVPESLAPVPRLVVTDLDGTFLSPDGTVSRANAEAVRDWCASGRHFLVATGRPLRWLDPVHDIAGVRPVVIASNGAMVHDLAADRSLAVDAIDATVAAAVIAELRDAVPRTRFGVEFGRSFGHEPGYRIDPLHRTLPGVMSGPIEEFLARGPFVKLLVQQEDWHADDLASHAEQVIRGRLTVTHSSGGRGLLEVSAAGVSKASALATLCARLGIGRDEVAAFGDMPNDREMLTWAGQPHVMEHSHPDLAGIGTVIGSNADSAVGAVLRDWLSR